MISLIFFKEQIFEKIKILGYVSTFALKTVKNWENPPPIKIVNNYGLNYKNYLFDNRIYVCKSEHIFVHLLIFYVHNNIMGTNQRPFVPNLSPICPQTGTKLPVFNKVGILYYYDIWSF